MVETGGQNDLGVRGHENVRRYVLFETCTGRGKYPLASKLWSDAAVMGQLELLTSGLSGRVTSVADDPGRHYQFALARAVEGSDDLA